MATSGSLSTNGYDGRYYKLEWTATQDVAKNQSKISWTLKALGGDVSWYAERTVKVKIAGTTVYSKTDRVQRYTGTVKSGTVTLTHDSAGKKSFSASLEVAVYYSTVNCTGSKTFTLTQIPRQATLTSAPNFDDEDNPIIKYSNPAGSAVSALDACIASSDGKTVYIPYRAISKTGSTYTFELTSSERSTLQNTCKNAKSMNVKFYVRTKIGDNTYYSSLQKTLSIVNANPTMNPEVFINTSDDTYKLTGSTTKLIRYYTYPRYRFNASALKGASIKSYTVTCGDGKGFEASGQFGRPMATNKFVFTVTDSRGNTTKQTVTADMVNYINLSCNIEYDIDIDGTATGSITGNFYNGSFGAENNTLSVKYRYREVGGTYTTFMNAATITKNGNTYSANFEITGLDYRKTYEIQGWAGDAFWAKEIGGGVYSGEDVMKVYPVYDWGENDFNVNANFNMNGQTVLRHNKEANNVVLSASGGHIYFRPGGTDDTEGEIRFTAQGDIIIGGKSLKSLLGID